MLRSSVTRTEQWWHALYTITQAVPQVLYPRMQHWALTLAAYEYQIVRRPGQSIPQADGLSRLPVGGAPRHVPVPADMILTMQCLDMSPVTAIDIRRYAVISLH